MNKGKTHLKWGWEANRGILTPYHSSSVTETTRRKGPCNLILLYYPSKRKECFIFQPPPPQ